MAYDDSVIDKEIEVVASKIQNSEKELAELKGILKGLEKEKKLINEVTSIATEIPKRRNK